MKIQRYNELAATVKEARDKEAEAWEIHEEANTLWKEANSSLAAASKVFDDYVRASMSADGGTSADRGVKGLSEQFRDGTR